MVCGSCTGTYFNTLTRLFLCPGPCRGGMRSSTAASRMETSIKQKYFIQTMSGPLGGPAGAGTVRLSGDGQPVPGVPAGRGQRRGHRLHGAGQQLSSAESVEIIRVCSPKHKNKPKSFSAGQMKHSKLLPTRPSGTAHPEHTPHLFVFPLSFTFW